MTLDEDHIALAAEYVLGTLDADEVARAETLIAEEPEFAALVRDWERRLGELNAMVDPVEPPADLLGRIKARIADMPPSAAIHLPDAEAARARPTAPPPRVAPLRAAPTRADHAAREASTEFAAPPPSDVRVRLVTLSRRAQRWRDTGIGFGALAAGLAAVLVTSLVRPELLPSSLRPKPKIVEVVKTVEVERPVEKVVEKPVRFVAVLQRDAASPAFILTVDVENRSMTVRKVAAEPQPGKSYELWLVSNQFPQPRSLGLIGAQEFSVDSQLASYQPETIRDATYAVTLEPEGGSPTGVATGPILWTGKLIEAIPATTP
jgi:anti-sigma-K factor RskA